MQNGDDLGTMLPNSGRPGPLTASEEERAARRREREARRRRRRGRRSIVLLVALGIVGAAAFGAYSVLRPMWTQLTAGDDYSGTGSAPVKVTIAEGASTTTIARTLAGADVVKSSGAFVEAASKDTRARSIQPGRYTLRKQMSGASALALLLDPKARDVDRVLLREGLRQSQVVTALARASGRPAAEYTKALRDPEALGLPAVARGRAEGWLFPDTYEFGPSSTPAQQLRTMVSRTKSVLAGLDVPSGMQQQVLTTASIVQAEGGSEKDFGKVARVIDNRLDDGMRLQLDSTVAYGTNKNGIFTTAAERADTSNRYNTYAHPGLPVGPISNPGKAAIQAALHPTPGDWMFFVVVNLDTGETKFTRNKADHDRYTRQFQDWYAKNR
ncbi:MAG TPA: endolytic transglycosylase MltG [Actinomycetales bacterium]|nr:endolytic transglycosylase MltG [Actinomycetales bacterium]